jgi:hypothetical protein
MRRGAIAAIASVIALGGCGQSQSAASARAVANCIRAFARTRTEPNHFEATYEASANATTVSWEGPVYPPLPKTELNFEGSGVAGYVYRYHVGNASWSAWQRTKGPDRPEFVLPRARLGTHIAVEVIATDDAGRAHRAVRASVTSAEPEKAGEVVHGRIGEECGEVRMYPE